MKVQTKSVQKNYDLQRKVKILALQWLVSGTSIVDFPGTEESQQLSKP